MGEDKQRLQAIVVMKILYQFRDNGVSRPIFVFSPPMRCPSYWIADMQPIKGQDAKINSLNAGQNPFRVANYSDAYALDDQRF